VAVIDAQEREKRKKAKMELGVAGSE